MGFLGQLTYNDITLYIVKTNNVEQSPVYTDDGVDYLYTKFRIDINTIYNPGATSYDNTDPPTYQTGFLPSQTNFAIRHFLMQPRGVLEFDGFLNPPQGVQAPIVDSPQEVSGGNLYPNDANLGPIPISCTITQVTSDRTFHIHYVIDTWLLECPTDPQNALLSNRFNQSETIDFNQYLTTRRTIGQAYFRTDVLENSGVVAGAFRQQIMTAFPPLFGFKRGPINFTVSPRKNAIQYEITDVELMYSMGDTVANQSFIDKVDATFAQGTMQDDRHGGPSLAASQQSMTVAVWGMRNASNWVLTQVAFAIIESKLQMGQIGQTALIRHINIVQKDTDRFVEVTVVLQVFNAENLKGVFFDATSMKIDDVVSKTLDPGNTLLNPNPQQNLGSAGSIAIDLLAADLGEACLPPTQNLLGTGFGGLGPPQYPVGSPPEITITTDDFLPSQPTIIKPTQPPYSRYYSESRYDYDSGAIQAPIANPNDPSSGSSSPILTPGALFKSEILNFTTPTMCLVVDWWAERIVTPPDIPNPVKNISFLGSDQQPVLKNFIVRPYSVAVANDLYTPIFSVSGTYEYMMPEAPDPTNPPVIVFDIPANIDATYGDATIGGSGSSDNGQYIHGVIDTG